MPHKALGPLLSRYGNLEIFAELVEVTARHFLPVRRDDVESFASEI